MGKNRKKSRNRTGLQVVTLCISTAMVLILLGMVVLTVFTGKNLSSYAKERLTVTMILAENMTDPEAQNLCEKVKTLPYIAGINYIYEMDFGDLSGWVYHVNGITPSRGCGEYVLEPGDRIEWLYTCELGNDL